MELKKSRDKFPSSGAWIVRVAAGNSHSNWKRNIVKGIRFGALLPPTHGISSNFVSSGFSKVSRIVSGVRSSRRLRNSRDRCVQLQQYSGNKFTSFSLQFCLNTALCICARPTPRVRQFQPIVRRHNTAQRAKRNTSIHLLTYLVFAAVVIGRNRNSRPIYSACISNVSYPDYL